MQQSQITAQVFQVAMLVSSGRTALEVRCHCCVLGTKAAPRPHRRAMQQRFKFHYVFNFELLFAQFSFKSPFRGGGVETGSLLCILVCPGTPYVDQLTEIYRPLPPNCWDSRCVPPCPASETSTDFYSYPPPGSDVRWGHDLDFKKLSYKAGRVPSVRDVF